MHECKNKKDFDTQTIHGGVEVPLLHCENESSGAGRPRRHQLHEKETLMKSIHAFLLITAIAIAPGVASAANEFDESAARALAKKSGCLKCHAIDKKKDAPSYKEIAAKYKGKPDAEDKLYKHATTNPEVEVDGKKEKHDSPKTKDEKEIRNLIRWILSVA